MKLEAVNVGKPKEVTWAGKTFKTSIYKTSIEGPVHVSYTNIEGDQQSDLNVHGGPTRAINVYAAEYYDYWKRELEMEELSWGFFGENLSISGGMFEEDIQVGDRFTIGTVELEALQPRSPCYKLGMRMGSEDWILRFRDSRKTGFYMGVIKEGLICQGDTVNKIHTATESITIDTINELYFFDKDNKALLEKAIQVNRLTPAWKDYFQKRLDHLRAGY